MRSNPNVFAAMAMMQAQQQRANIDAFMPQPRPTVAPPPKPKPPEESCRVGWLTASRGLALHIIQELSTTPGLKFTYETLGESGWIFKRLHIKYEMRGDPAVLERVTNWLSSLERSTQDQK